MNVQLLIIDPQKDFCSKSGSLFVQGADLDMQRVSNMIKRIGSKLDDIHVTMDSHHIVDIAHPIFWKDKNGKHPAPFTVITVDDVEKARWIPTLPMYSKWALEYVKSLHDNNRYVHCIWPEHCIIGSEGHSLDTGISDALNDWERSNFAIVDYCVKGSNLATEHFSAVQAEVIRADDPSTQLNTRLIDTLQTADLIAICGEALSHCLANTVRDIANNFGDENIKKLVLLTDGSSSVTGFENLGTAFVNELTARGMQLSTTTDFLN